MQYRQEHIPIKATIIEHMWTDNNRLVLRYKYEVNGVSYIGESGSYGEAEYRSVGKLGRILKRKSAASMQGLYPIGSKHTVYYKSGKPWITHFESYG